MDMNIINNILHIYYIMESQPTSKVDGRRGRKWKKPISDEYREKLKHNLTKGRIKSIEIRKHNAQCNKEDAIVPLNSLTYHQRLNHTNVVKNSNNDIILETIKSMSAKNDAILETINNKDDTINIMKEEVMILKKTIDELKHPKIEVVTPKIMSGIKHKAPWIQ